MSEQTKKGRKRRELERTDEAEFRYEVDAIDFEAPEVAPVEAPTFTPGSFDAGFCWCGMKARSCTGNPTKTNELGQYVCPHGQRKRSAGEAVVEAARNAGLIQQEEDSNG